MLNILNFFQSPKENNDWEKLREKMVNEQIILKGIKDKKIIQAMKTTHRHLFVPEIVKDKAYEDSPLPIGNEQTISQPYIVACMLELLELTKDKKVLEIGTGSGYQTALLSILAKEVYSIDLVKEFTLISSEKLNSLGYKNIFIKHDDGYKGWEEHSPFSTIILSSAPPHIPEKLLAQLDLGGRMVLPLGTKHQELVLIKKEKDGIKRETLFPVSFVPMVKNVNF